MVNMLRSIDKVLCLGFKEDQEGFLEEGAFELVGKGWDSAGGEGNKALEKWVAHSYHRSLSDWKSPAPAFLLYIKC